MAESTTSFWIRTNRPSKSYDLVIAGGGIIGCSTAFWLRELRPELRVAIVEREYIGSGASGRNAGFILQGTATAFASDVERFGLETARRLYQLTLDNRNLVFERLPHKLIRARATGSVTAAGSQFEDNKLAESEVLLRESGFEATHLDAAEVSRRTASIGFFGGLHSPSGGVVDPVLLLRHLTEAGGADVFEYDPVRSVAQGDGRIVVEGERTKFEASKVLVSANAYLPLLLGKDDLPDGIVRPIRAQMLATEPVPPVLEMPVYSHDGYFYIRQHDSGSILLGGARHLHEADEVGYADATTPELQNDLEAYLATHFPTIKPQRVEARWSGVMGFSPDARPLFGNIDRIPGAHWIAGFTGHGMSVAFRAGLFTARMLLGDDDEYRDLFDRTRLVT